MFRSFKAAPKRPADLAEMLTFSLVGVRGFEPPAPASRRQSRAFALVCNNQRGVAEVRM